MATTWKQFGGIGFTNHYSFIELHVSTYGNLPATVGEIHFIQPLESTQDQGKEDRQPYVILMAQCTIVIPSLTIHISIKIWKGGNHYTNTSNWLATNCLLFDAMFLVQTAPIRSHHKKISEYATCLVNKGLLPHIRKRQTRGVHVLIDQYENGNVSL